MKRILSVILALAMIIAVTSTAFALDITAETPSTDSNGVYQIGTAAELYGFAELVNNGQTSINAVLTADIVINDNVLNENGELNSENSGAFASWTPIGNYDVQYAGSFDGQGHTISGLYFNNPDTDYVGLFGLIVSGGKVSNVRIVDSYIYGKRYVGGVCGFNVTNVTITACYNAGTINGSGDNVGGVCGFSSSTIIACYNAGVVSGTSKNVGGVCGYNYFGTMTDCYNTGTVSGTSDDVGGVCGQSHGTISACYNSGTVSGTSNSNNVGGVCGFSYSTMTDCYNTGTVSGTSDYVGGVCGYNTDSATITGCYNTGTVSGEKDYVGGVCGYNISSATITGCYNSGTVSGTGSYVGGVCGYNISSATITACYNTGEVSGTSDYVGGVCGQSYATITACYNMGTVSGTYNYIGGVCGSNTGTITGCYVNSGNVCGDDSLGMVTDCNIYSNAKFADGTVRDLLNKALSDAGYDNVYFYQIIGKESYPVLTDSTVTAYIVTIPEAIKLGEAVTVSATDVTLKRVETLTVAITETSEEDNAFKLRSAEDALLEYSVKSDDKNIAIGDAILTLGYKDSQGEATLNFVPESAKFSGSYSGTVTFTISVG